MRAFNGEQSIKDAILSRIAEHREAGNIVRNVEWKDGKGGAAAVTVNAYKFDRFETELGIPNELGRIEDRIFDGLHKNDGEQFAVDFIEAIEPGADLSAVKYRFFLRLLSDPDRGAANMRRGLSADRVDRVAALFQRAVDGDIPTIAEWKHYQRPASGDFAVDVAYAAAHMGSYAVLAAFDEAKQAKMGGHYEWMRDVLLEELKAAPVMAEAA